MNRRALLAVLCPVVAVALVFFAAKRTKTEKAITPGKDTTVIDGPLDAVGLIDYETALNERLRGKTTPDTNAVVLLLMAVGPQPERGTDLHPDVYTWLGTSPPPAEGNYLLRSSDYFHDEYRGNWQAFTDRESGLRDRLWTEADDPKVFAWVTANEKPLMVVAEATKRPDYFHPLVARERDGSRLHLIFPHLPLVYRRCHEMAVILALRVSLRCGEKQYDAAWRDVMTMHRLGRLIVKGGTITELQVGFAIDSVARNSALRLLEAAQPTAAQALAWRHELAGLPPFPPLAEKVEWGERFTFLDVCQFLRRDGVEVLKQLGVKDSPNAPPDLLAESLPHVDWNRVLKTGNRWFDRLAAELRHPTCGERTAALTASDAELTKAADIYRSDGPPMNTSDAVGVRLIRLMLPGTARRSDASDRQEVLFQTELLAFALAAYDADHKKYPARLADLVPKYAASISTDLYDGQELIYRHDADGYSLYSVGPNGTDDGGRFQTDLAGGDDIGVRMPNAKK